MSIILSFQDITEKDRGRVGGKGYALAVMAERGINVPRALCVTTDAYRRYMKATGLGDMIVMEVFRKRFEDMRWEEIWDTALRVRSRFLKATMPPDLKGELQETVKTAFGNQPVKTLSK